jgi:hypothetical protein
MISKRDLREEVSKAGASGRNMMKLKTFLARNELSRTSYCDLQRKGLGPREIRIGSEVYITRREERRWAKSMS